jgi:hypothetical protein
MLTWHVGEPPPASAWQNSPDPQSWSLKQSCPGRQLQLRCRSRGGEGQGVACAPLLPPCGASSC